ncbi:MAG: ATP synthase F0 subunit B [Eubacteriales bacterium]|nr:ATP synthase F0 subunit B [Eubacteriales bacterium]
MLSINVWNILFTVINVLILFFLIKKFLFKPVHNILEQREKEIADKYAESDRIRSEADAMKAEYQAVMDGLEEDRKQGIAEARKEAREKADRMIEDTQKYCDQMVEEARRKGAAAAEQERRKGEELIAEMVRTAAGKIVNAESNEQMFDEFLKEVEREADKEALTKALAGKDNK